MNAAEQAKASEAIADFIESEAWALPSGLSRDKHIRCTTAAMIRVAVFAIETATGKKDTNFTKETEATPTHI